MYRLDPLMPVQNYKTYSLINPINTHFRKATCAEAECANFQNGWRLRVEGLSLEDLHVAKNCGRRFTEQHVAEGETWLVYEAGQPCFAASEHRVANDRPPICIVRSGDWRGNPDGQSYRHTSLDFWVEDSAEHQQMLADRINRG